MPPETTNSPRSGSDGSQAYDRLHPEIRRWIREQGWDDLRDIQARTIAAILDGDGDIVIAATTAAGKTEAAFLPILTRVAARKQPGLSVLYVGPLKALINDQFLRLDQLCERMEIPVVRWHGDAPQAAKARVLARPAGIALITPESIEAMLVRRPADAHRLLHALDFIVVDELHYFMAGPRGLHLAALLKRIEALAARSARRVGLSATIGDLAAAASWLRPAAPERVTILEARAKGGELRLQIRGYVDHAIEAGEADEGTPATPEAALPAFDAVATHVFHTLRGQNNLVFAPSRSLVETMSDRLRATSEENGVPNEFFPHHGSLAKDLREPLEARLKAGNLPTTAVCTSTLELGIDIGSIVSVAQLGAPRSLAALRQRLGRTGRRKDVPSILRIYVRERAIETDMPMLDRLRPNIVRSVAAIRLLTSGFVEPPSTSDALATGLVHQTLSIIAEKGGARADAIYRQLAGPGPFASVTVADYAELLRNMAETRLVEQAPDGTLMLSAQGERLVQAKEFYALFASEAEWRLVVGARPLGTIPLSNIVALGNLVVFAGRRWRVEGIDERRHVLQVAPHTGGQVPKFDRLQAEISHDRLIAEMRQVYRDADVPAYLDEQARELLAEGRQAYRQLALDETPAVQDGRDLNLFIWRGNDVSAVMAVALAMAGLNAEPHDLGVTITNISRDELRPIAETLASLSAQDLDSLPAFIKNLRAAKFDDYAPVELLQRMWLRKNRSIIDGIASCVRSCAL